MSGRCPLLTRSPLALLALLGLTGIGCGGPRPSTTPPTATEAAATEAASASIASGVIDALVAGHAAHRAPGLDRRSFDPAAYWHDLLPLLEGSDRFRVRTIGASVEGRPLRRVDFGNGDTTVLLWSQMHGNESTASRSLADIFRFLVSNPEHPLVRRIEEELAVTVVPIVNPDGAARFIRHNALGIDLNRDARRLVTPEARALKAVRDEIDADWGFNLHDQNVRTRLGSSGRDVRIALLAPPPGAGIDNAANRAARRMCSLLAAALEPVVGDQVARYNESFNPRAFGDSMTSWGTSVVLIESGGELGDPDKELLRRANYVAILVALHAIATESWQEMSPSRYLNLPLNAPWVYDLVVRGAAIVLPGQEPVRADFAINFDDTLAREGGVIVEVGDLDDAAALDVVDAEGLFFVPAASVVEDDAGTALRIGAAASGVVARDPAGGEVILEIVDGRVVERRAGGR